MKIVVRQFKEIYAFDAECEIGAIQLKFKPSYIELPNSDLRFQYLHQMLIRFLECCMDAGKRLGETEINIDVGPDATEWWLGILEILNGKNPNGTT